MEPVRLGVVGCGVIGTAHLRTATSSPLIELVAIADMIEEKARQAAETYHPKRVYANGGDLVKDADIEGVILAFPTSGRTALALQAFAQGKHVLTEKPVAMNADEVRQMIGARGNRIAGCCSSRFRFLEGARVAMEFLASGALGALRVVRCRDIRAAREKPATIPPAWRLRKALNGGGILVNWGCYDLDYLLGITGWTLKPRLALAQTWTIQPQFESHIVPDSDAETHYVAFVLCEGGTVLTLERGEYMAAHSEDAWQIIGTRGSLTLKMTEARPKRLIHDDTTTEQGVLAKTLWEGDETTYHDGPATDFARAIRENQSPMTSLEQALVVQQITDAIYASAARGAAVEVV